MKFLLVPLFLEDERCWATVAELGVVPTKVVYEVSSSLEDGRGSLDTVAERTATAMPTRDTHLRQLFVGGSPEVLYKAHVEGLRHLTSRGIAVDEAKADAFVRRYQEDLRRSRAHFLAAPVRRAMLTQWRILVGAMTDRGPVAEQPRTERAIKELQGARG